ncbi:hypothetical protein J7K28_02055 [Candidatus Aerophobetes bacterium]|nr:hypothetical protein [Candidatus Aerophobetes bacterium]
MIITAFLEVIKRIIIYHLFPSLIVSCTVLLLVLGIIKVFRLKSPSIRGSLFFVALLKPLFTLIQGTSPAPLKVYPPIAVGVQLPDPLNFIPAHLWYNEAQVVDTNMSISLSLILMATSLFLFYRWRSYYLFCQSLSTQSSLQKEKEEFRSILTKLRKKIGVQARLFITRTEYESPFSLGVRDPLMVFPSYILAQLTPEEKEAVFTHELVHIRQRDTF